MLIALVIKFMVKFNRKQENILTKEVLRKKVIDRFIAKII